MTNKSRRKARKKKLMKRILKGAEQQSLVSWGDTFVFKRINGNGSKLYRTRIDGRGYLFDAIRDFFGSVKRKFVSIEETEKEI